MITATTLKSDLLNEAKDIRHAFFTREGGISEGIYQSLNCGYGSNDDRTAVTENRRRAAEYLGSSHEDIATAHQVHSAKALVINAPFGPDGPPQADALVTQTPGLAIGVLAADCTPVLFADQQAKVVGAAHAGWRGASSGILEATLEVMEAVGAKRNRIYAAIGPTIHQPNYEVGPEFEAEFLKRDTNNQRFFVRYSEGGNPFFDLPGFCYARLQAASVRFIDNIAQCTYENDSLFFSYRRKTHGSEPDYGRQISAIAISS